MDRRAFLAVAAGIVAAPRASGAQQAGKVARIGILGDTSPPVDSPGSGDAAFRQGLRDLGHVEGRNVTMEYRWA